MFAPDSVPMPLVSRPLLHLLLCALLWSVSACAGDVGEEGAGDIDERDVGDRDAGDGWTPADAMNGDAWGADVDDTEAWPRIARIDVEMRARDLTALRRDPQSRKEFDAVLVVDGRRYPDGEIELHGGFARTVPKLSYRIKFDADDPWTTTGFSPEPEVHRRLVLQASWIDPTFIRNCLTHSLVRELGGLAPRCQYVALSFNGEPQGLFVGIERVDREYLLRNGLAGDGLVLKASNHNADWGDKANPLDGFEIQINEDAPTDGIDELLRVCSETDTTFTDFEQSVAPRLDLGDFMVWQQAHTLADNRDTFTKNYYLHYDWVRSTLPFRLISWDSDATWGRNWDGAVVDPREETRLWGSDRFAPRLFSIADYAEPYAAQYAADVLDGELRAWLHDEVDAAAELIRDAARDDLAFWQPDADFDEEIEALHEAIDARFDVLGGELGP